jgi:hypothetical protein
MGGKVMVVALTEFEIQIIQCAKSEFKIAIHAK